MARHIVVAGSVVGPTEPDPVFEVNFDDYADSQAFYDDSTKWNGWNHPAHEAASTIQTAEVAPPSSVGFSKVWHMKQNNMPDCSVGNGAGRDMIVGNLGNEIWFEVWYYMSANFKTNFGCGGNPDHKFIFIDRVNGSNSGRWSHKHGENSRFYSWNTPGHSSVNTWHDYLPNSDFNGLWQRHRFHVRGASSSGVNDGAAIWKRVEIDNPNVVYVIDGIDQEVDLSIDGDGIVDEAHDGFGVEIQMGITMNQGPLSQSPEQFWEWGRIRIWAESPGWGW